MWKHATRTLAPESRHIVVVIRVDTISRAADCFLSFVCVHAYPTAAIRCRRPRRDSAGGIVRVAAGTNEDNKTMMWTDERVELLKKLWTDGLSASQIAAELGGITRNAVIGKVHRLGLSGRAKSASTAAPRQRKARSSSHMLRMPRGSIRGNTALAHAYDYEV